MQFNIDEFFRLAGLCTGKRYHGGFWSSDTLLTLNISNIIEMATVVTEIHSNLDQINTRLIAFPAVLML